MVIPKDLPVESAVARYRRPEPAPADLLAMADSEPEQTRFDSISPEADAMPGVITADVGFSRVIRIQQQSVGIVRVEVEETLGHYAEWAGVSASRIRRLNDLSFGRPLHLHQKVKIPLAAVAAKDFEARRYEFHKRLQEDFYAAYRVGELQRYRVQPGDSYWTLCRDKFDLPLWLLRHYNTGVNLAELRIHQSLTIPAIERVPENSPDA
jgi:membrane-bound lytic murein transglycosylase D